ALLVPIAISACAKKQERPQRPAATVAVAVARRTNVPYVIEANGVVTPVQTVAVTPQVDGIITSVDFQEGQEVREGTPLFHIDARPYQNAYNQAVAVLVRDSASWANAKSTADRYKQLMSAKVITPIEGEAQLTTAATSEATVSADRAAVAQAKFNLDNSIIRAPIAGKTGSLLIRQGNLVHSGSATPLVVINQVRPIAVRFAIPSSQLGLVLQYGASGGLPVAAVPGGVAPASPSIDSLAAAAMNPVNDTQGTDASGHAGNGGGNAGSGDGFGGGSGTASTDGTGGPNAGRHRGGRNGGANAENTGGPSAAMPNGGATHRRGMNGGDTTAGANGGSGARRAGANGAAGGGQTPVQQQGAPQGERLMGKLSFIDNAVDTSTGTVQLKAMFDNGNGRLWAGQFASTSLHLYDEQNALVVPQQAVVTGQRGAYVYIVDPTDTARQRAVTVERNSGGLAIISNGINEGDRVVIDGQARLTPDAPVRFRGVDDGGARGAGGGRRGRRGGNGGGATGGGSGAAGAGNRGGGTGDAAAGASSAGGAASAADGADKGGDRQGARRN
ncbi:MAG TPA: efflux RND transporter periplasmic adaptor subunit, partial [Gemmatimonadaceae bacterium]